MGLVPSPAVVRASELLRHLASNPTEPLTVSELARRVGLPRATCDTLLLGLAIGGFVRRDGELRYELGPACMVVGDAARAAHPALRAAARQAEVLAQEISSVVAVTVRDREELRVADVFDFGPPLGFRARMGDAIELVPPFGASFVAWGDEDEIRLWLDRTDPPLSPAEAASYRSALEGVRRRGFSVTLVTARQPKLIKALKGVARGDNAGAARQERAEAARQMSHTEYLPPKVDFKGSVRVAQVSAPVFESDGEVEASIMLLGPAHDLTAEEIAKLGDRVARAAAVATGEIHGRPPGGPL
ncbi:MAG TPA: helix-turn-helix domain-containing protein [Acidimicrobiales bacterium]|nr:helix-turn-helix domain-containing protein [Acidimicrobiales bacterium]